MIGPNIPAPNEALKDLHGELIEFYAAIEAGLDETRLYFDQRKEKEIDPFLAPNLVRYSAKRYLHKHGRLVADDVEEAVDETASSPVDSVTGLQILANNGLCWVDDRYHLRIRKGDWRNGDVGFAPAPGPSRAAQAFYSQVPWQPALPFDLPELETATPDEPPHLLLIWQVTSAYRLVNMWLVCPKSGGNGRSLVDVNWAVQLPHAATTIRVEEDLVDVAAAAAPFEDIHIQARPASHVAELDDLPIAALGSTEAAESAG